MDLMELIKNMKGMSLYFSLKRGYFRVRTAIIPSNVYGKILYFLTYRRLLHLSSSRCRRYDEKLWWLKEHYHNPLMTVCADKWAVREYVKQCGLEEILNVSFGHFKSIEDIKIDDIPDEDFFVKCNHLSGGNIICHKSTFSDDLKKVRPLFRELLKNNCYYYGYEWPYKNIKPSIVVEKVLCTDELYGLLDYKFMCFEGEPRLLFLDIGVAQKNGTHAKEYYRNIYDMDFVPTKIKETREHYDYSKIPKPENWEFMKECCRKLSKPFPHCRVDLYNIHGKVYFGEITFYHGSGMNRIEPDEADLMMGSWIPMVEYGHI